jgi:hypothetical protein
MEKLSVFVLHSWIGSTHVFMIYTVPYAAIKHSCDSGDQEILEIFCVRNFMETAGIAP